MEPGVPAPATFHHRTPERRALRAIALFEAAKGLLVILVGLGFVTLVKGDIGDLAEDLVRLAHLNPAHQYPKIFIDAANNLADKQMTELAMLAGAYVLLRFVQAYGLWFERVWGEWLTMFAGGLYIPLEINELVNGVTPLRMAALLINIAVVVFIVRLRLIERKRKNPEGGRP